MRYCDVFDSTVYPFWQSHPPSYRLSRKPYKSTCDKNSYLPETSLTFKARSRPPLDNIL